MPTRYPCKLQKPSTISSEVRDTAETFIMDSGIGDDVSNKEVLELADEYNAEYVVAKDYLHDHEKTTESVLEFLELYESHVCDSIPLIPLQPPYDEHYTELEGYDRYVLGGIALDEITLSQKLKYIRDFRRVAPEVYAHGLGVGGGIQFIRKVAGTGLLDSVDCATPEMAGQYGCVLDSNLRQTEIRVMSGEGARKRNTALSEFNSWQVQDVWDRECEKSGLERWQ